MHACTHGTHLRVVGGAAGAGGRDGVGAARLRGGGVRGLAQHVTPCRVWVQGGGRTDPRGLDMAATARAATKVSVLLNIIC